MKESICSQRGSVNTFLLSALENDDKYAYEIGKAVKEISGGKFVLKEASLYSGLKRLEDKGFLTSYSKEVENGLTRRYYSLTETGRQKLNSLNFSWDSEQKGNILKAVTMPSGTQAEDVEVAPTINSITISDEDNNLVKHNIHENQQDMFDLMHKPPIDDIKENNNVLPSDTNTEIINENKQNSTDESLKSSIKNVNDFEFINLKNSYKTTSTPSFLDSINSEKFKEFNYSLDNNKLNEDFKFNLEKQTTLMQVEESAYAKNAEPLNLEEPPQKQTIDLNLTLTNKTDENNATKTTSIDISSIFGDLCINNEEHKQQNDATLDLNKELNAENLKNIDSLKNNYVNLKDNINCTLQIPTHSSKNNEIPEGNVKQTESDLSLQEENVGKNLNDILKHKVNSYKPSITVNNSVLYANQKIDYDKPTFDSKFSNNLNHFETRMHAEIIEKNIKSTFINVYKVKSIASIFALFTQILLVLGIYFIFDKTPIVNFSKLQIALYTTSLTLIIALSLANLVLYFNNKYKISKNLEIKTNIFLKLLLGMCVISTLFIIYKFFEINLTISNNYLILLPASIFISLFVEEIIKFLLIKLRKNK